MSNSQDHQLQTSLSHKTIMVSKDARSSVSDGSGTTSSMSESTQNETVIGDTNMLESKGTSITADQSTIQSNREIDKKRTKLRRELSIQDQSSRMPRRKIFVVYFGIGLALMVSFMDQTAVSTAAPNISTELGGSESMSWIGTSFFVANCAFQLVYGRLSDIVGRKIMLQLAVVLLVLGNLLCSFAQTPIQLYIFRSISGIGGGGINNIAMVIVSDVVPLKERGKYQGLVSAACSVGTAIGPFVGGGLATAGQWRWLFRVISLLGVVVILLIHFIIPLKPVIGSAKEKLARIDYLGVLLSAASIVFLLVPISGGGSTFAWSGSIVIGLLVAGVITMALFLLVEWRLAKLPILPLRLFRLWTPTVVNAQSFFIGMIMYGNIFYIPIYLQYVKGRSALVSGALSLAYMFPQSLWGILSGLYITKTNHYKRVIVGAAVAWTVGLGLQILWKPFTSIGMTIGILQITAIGVGCSLQTTLIAALATSLPKDRAIITGSRNFFRTMGGSFGLAIANALYQPGVTSHLEKVSSLSDTQRTALLSSALSDLESLSSDTLLQVREAYSLALRSVFICFTAIAAVCIVLSTLIQEVTFASDSAALEAERTKSKNSNSHAEVGTDIEKLDTTSANDNDIDVVETLPTQDAGGSVPKCDTMLTSERQDLNVVKR